MQVFVEQVQNSAANFEEITRMKLKIYNKGDTQSLFYIPLLENHKNKK